MVVKEERRKQSSGFLVKLLQLMNIAIFITVILDWILAVHRNGFKTPDFCLIGGLLKKAASVAGIFSPLLGNSWREQGIYMQLPICTLTKLPKTVFFSSCP